jgi:cytochrome c5
LGQGLDGLVNSALKGKGAMGAQAGGDFNDTEIARAVVYLVNSAGGKFEVPKAPAAEAAK